VSPVETQADALKARVVSLERQLAQARRRIAELTPAHVVAQRLHASLDRKQVILALEEIVAGLVGCEQLAVFELVGAPEVLTLVAAVGVPGESNDSTYPGAARIAHGVASGETWLAPAGAADSGDEPPLSACIPLKVDGRVTGALALYRMLDHRGALEPADLPLLEMLSTHAGIALAASRPTAVEAAR